MCVCEERRKREMKTAEVRKKIEVIVPAKYRKLEMCLEYVITCNLLSFRT